MGRPEYKTSLAAWLPLGLRRVDAYFARFYLKIFFFILIGLIVLVSIGDLVQRYDDFVSLSRLERRDTEDLLALFVTYYASFVPQLAFQYMLPAVMLLAASITVTASFCGPRGNNEFIVIRSSGIPALRAFLPLLGAAFLMTALFQAGRDFFLPGMIREYNGIYDRIRSRRGMPTCVSLLDGKIFKTVAVGAFDADGTAHNLLIEQRDGQAFLRGDPGLGDNDFTAYRAAAARLEKAPDGGYRWRPLAKGEIHSYTRFSRRSVPWTEPAPTIMSPAMIERQIFGDAVSSWADLLFLSGDHPGADFELHWRLAEPLACCLLILCGAGLCMGRMLRYSAGGYIPAVGISLVAAALFYILRLVGKSLWEMGKLGPEQGVWLPLAAAAAAAAVVAWWMEP